MPESLGGGWTLRLTTDAVGYGGSGRLGQRVEGFGPRAEGARQSVEYAAQSGALGDGPPFDAPRALLEAEPHATATVTVPPWTAALYIRHS